MRRTRRIISPISVFMLLLALFPSCGKFDSKPPENTSYASFRDIPGVTGDEIKAIEELQKLGVPFIYGTPLSTEAFVNEEGELDGFAILLCDWLGGLFGIPFWAEVDDLTGILAKMKTGEVNFGALTLSEDRLKNYYMTAPIMHRSAKVMRIKGKPSPAEIALSRPPRYAFMEGSTLMDSVTAVLEPGSYEAVVAGDHETIYEMLKSGEADAYIGNNIVESAFDSYGGVVTEDFLPLTITPVSLAAEDPALAPLISVVSKALASGAYKHLTELYRRGYTDYKKNKFLMELSDEERAYVRNTPVIPFAAQFMSYPVSFYNANEEKWEGIVFDVLDEMEKLTGFKFKLVNDETTDLPELMKLLENGTAYVMPNLIQSDERRKRFIWPNATYLSDKFALLSKRSYPNIELNDIPFARVGFAKGSAFADLFRSWFPDALYAVEYPGTDDAFMAVERGEIDMVMSSQSRLTALTNYYEFSDYKANYLFGAAFDASFGLNKNQTVLCSIIDKALPLIDTGRIAEQWLSRTYNIETMRLKEQRPWLFGSLALFLCVLALLAVLFARSRRAGRRLENIVKERTHDFELQTAILTTLFDSIPDLIFTMDTALRFTQCNKSFLEYFGFSKDGIINKGENDLGLPPGMAEGHDNWNRRVIEEGRVIAQEEILSRVDGRNPLYETVKAPLVLDGKVIGLLAIARDITRRKEMEVAALSASRSKSAFLANMSHEIRTPMNSIIGFSELAMDGEASVKTREYLAKIQSNAEWLLQIINDILDISKIESGKMELENIPFDMHELFESCRTLIIPKAAEKGLALQFYAEPSVGKRPLGDPTRLRQILVNLLSNAVKFTNSGTIKVLTEIKQQDEKNVTFHFEIKDSGIGMTEDQIKRIFEPFMQAETGTTRKYGGTGLGLAISKNFIELMGGRLAVESVPGIGSKFSFDLSFATIDITGYESLGRKTVLNEIEKPYFNGEVLLCEDNVMNQQVICEHLARVGLKTVIAENGKTGVEIVQRRREKGEKQFDLIFMDIHMPVMDGVEAAAKIIELNTGIPIVAMTANIMSNDMEIYKTSGMNDCVGKPFSSQELWRCLLKYLTPLNGGAVQKNAQIETDMEFQNSLRLLFVKDNQKKCEEIASALETGDIKLAHRLAHTLKSNAGQLGRIHLQQAAADVEERLKGGENLVTPRQMAVLEKELNAALAEFASTLNESPRAAGGEPLDAEAARELLAKLEPMLKMGNPECRAFIDSLRRIPESEKLIQQIENFDFEQAMLLLTELKERL